MNHNGQGGMRVGTDMIQDSQTFICMLLPRRNWSFKGTRLYRGITFIFSACLKFSAFLCHFYTWVTWIFTSAHKHTWWTAVKADEHEMT